MKSNFLNTLQQPILLFIVLWFILILSLPIDGYYTLNDSYVYVWGAKNFFNYGFNLHPLVSPTLLFQTLFGGVIYDFFGSVSVFRYITSFFYLISVIYFYKFLQLFGINKLTATFSSLLLMFNPLVIYLGFTFMSDIYFLCFLIVSYYYYVLFFKNHNISNLYLSSIFVSFMFFSRQTALIVFPVMVIFLYFSKKNVKDVLLFSALPIISIITYQIFFPKTLAYSDQSISLTIQGLLQPTLLREVFYRLIFSLYYLGFFVIPFTSYYFVKNIIPKKLSLLSLFTKRVIMLCTVFLFLFFVSLWFWFNERQLMFYLPNILSYAGFNPQNINDGIKQTIFVDSPVRIRAFYTVLSMFSLSIFAVFLAESNKKLKNLKNNLPVLSLVVSTILLFILTLVFRDFFDRYLLVLLPLVLLTVSLYSISKDKYVYIYIIPLLFLGIFSFIYEYDYLSLNKRMWEVTYNSKEYPMLNPSNTHASFEYNNYFKLDESYNITNSQELFDRDWLRPKEDSEYLVSYTDVWGYCRLSKVEYNTLMFGLGNNGYFHIMVKGSNPFEPKECNKIVNDILNAKR